MQHIGNNVYLGWKSLGDSTDTITSDKSVYISVEEGTISTRNDGSWNTITFGTKSDQLAASITFSITKSNIGTSYTYVYPDFYGNVPIGLDLKGFSKIGFVIFWNKNNGTGRHDIKLVNKANPLGTPLVTSENMESGLVNGVNKNYDIIIPSEFENFRGEVALGAKSTVGTDSPIIDGLFIYTIR